MRIAIINMTAGGMSGGYRKYLQNVLPRMAAHPDIESILCALPESLNVRDWFGPLPNVEFVRYQPFRFLRHKVSSELRHYLKRFHPDVIFIPVERFFEFEGVPIVNMIQNMEPFVSIDGNPLRERSRNWLRRLDARKALKRSNRIIAPSEYVRDFLLHNLKMSSGKIGLVYHGVDLPENKDAHRPDIIPKGWDGRFLFAAGSIRPARGLEDILGAMIYLNNNPRDISGLVIAGSTTPGMEGYRKHLDKWAQKNDISSKVCWAGSLNRREMAWCYENCQAFVMTSRVESFGMVTVEAMSHESICVAADNHCLPEIFDDAAIFYPPKKPQILAERVQEVLHWTEEKKQKMRQRALTRASQFSWDRCAERTVEELRKAIDEFRKEKQDSSRRKV